MTRAAGSPGTAGANFRVDDPCLMPIADGRVCTLPGDDCHLHGCTDQPQPRCGHCVHRPHGAICANRFCACKEKSA